VATSRLSSRVDERTSVEIVQLLEATRQRQASSAEHNDAQATGSAHLSCWQHGGRGNCQWCGVGVNHGAILVSDAAKVFLCRDCAAKFRSLLAGGGEAQHRNAGEPTVRLASNRDLTAV
jgi:hypothetical protein